MASLRAAIVQRAPVLLHREETIERVLAGLEEADPAGAALVVFPETYLPAIPSTSGASRPGGDYDLSREIHGRLLANAVDLDAGDLRPVLDATAARP